MKRGSAEFRSAGLFFPAGKKGQVSMLEYAIVIVLVLLIFGLIAYVMVKKVAP